MDTSEFISPVRLVRAYKTSTGARVAISLRANTDYQVTNVGDKQIQVDGDGAGADARRPPDRRPGLLGRFSVDRRQRPPRERLPVRAVHGRRSLGRSNSVFGTGAGANVELLLDSRRILYDSMSAQSLPYRASDQHGLRERGHPLDLPAHQRRRAVEHHRVRRSAGTVTVKSTTCRGTRRSRPAPVEGPRLAALREHHPRRADRVDQVRAADGAGGEAGEGRSRSRPPDPAAQLRAGSRRRARGAVARLVAWHRAGRHARQPAHPQGDRAAARESASSCATSTSRRRR